MDKVLEILKETFIENSITIKVMEKILKDDLIAEVIIKSGYAVLKIISVLFIYKVGRRVVDKIVSTCEKTKYYNKLDESVKSFFHSFISLCLKSILMIFCLVQLGIKGSSLLAFLGTMGVGVGLALKDSVANLAGGIIVLVFKNYRVGDYIDIGGLSGEVRAINVLTTQIVTFDNKSITVPNGNITANPLTNYSTKRVRRVDITVSISYDDNLDLARRALMDMVVKIKGVISVPAPQVLVGEFADSSINLFVRVWCETENYWDVHFRVMEQIKPVMDENNLTIPYPQMDIHHQNPVKNTVKAAGRDIYSIA